MPGPLISLLDVAKRTDPNGKISQIIELLEQENGILKDMHFEQCNDGTTHKTTTRVGYPTAYWRLYNRGVPKSKSQTTNITDHTAMLEARSEIDKDLVDINANPAEYRFSEDIAFMSAMNNQMAETLFYGDANKPESFVGLTPRFNKLSTDAKNAGSHIIDAGGGSATDLTSIWFIGHGPRTVHGLYPRGSKAGFSHEDKGVQTVYDDDKNPFDAYVSKFTWKNGLSVRDWRYVVRIANVSIAALSGATPPDLIKLMIQATHMVPENRMGVRFGFYCREEILTALDIQTLSKTNAALRYSELQGEPVLQFRTYPIRRCDALKSGETRVV